jgi:hypothetical protein
LSGRLHHRRRPSGIGVREAVLVAALAPVLSTSAALAAARNRTSALTMNSREGGSRFARKHDLVAVGLLREKRVDLPALRDELGVVQLD